MANGIAWQLETYFGIIVMDVIIQKMIMKLPPCTGYVLQCVWPLNVHLCRVVYTHGINIDKGKRM